MAQEAKPHAGGAGKPGKGEMPKDPKARALVNLQYAFDRAANFIHDGTASYARRAKTAARQGIPKERVLRGIAELNAVIEDARKAIDIAYAAPEEKKRVERRITL